MPMQCARTCPCVRARMHAEYVKKSMPMQCAGAGAGPVLALVLVVVVAVATATTPFAATPSSHLIQKRSLVQPLLLKCVQPVLPPEDPIVALSVFLPAAGLA